MRGTSIRFRSYVKIRFPFFGEILVELVEEGHEVGRYAYLIRHISLIEWRIAFGLEDGKRGIRSWGLHNEGILLDFFALLRHVLFEYGR